MTNKLNNILNELQQRLELSEYHILCVYCRNSSVENDFNCLVALKVINPKNPYSDMTFCFDRKHELQRKYFDADGMLKNDLGWTMTFGEDKK